MAKPDYEWIQAGEEWSEPWGGSEPQWFGSILPRIEAGLPANTILEIASGFGRWSYYLKEHCSRLHLVDPATECIEACRRRFASDPRVNCHVNDGRSLEMIPDGSIDFVFSFDSLVHVKRETVEAYLAQLAGKLTEDGLGFIHHSNLGQYASSVARRVRKLVSKGSVIGSDHQRNPEMTARLFRDTCEQHGLRCLCQELVNWRGRRLIDCFSTVARMESKWKAAARPFHNHNFMLEAQLIRRRSQNYPRISATS
ncbi:MAG TPA: class I SAM-dependent methyltransferase [Chthoniobacterales bacterium]|nr:class I SAM-dependent methyltransferase [Chthoniobacterales bacterium]